MKKQLKKLDAIKLVGLTIRTNNKNEMHPETSKIADLATRYMRDNIAETLIHRAKPGVTYSAYTEYESDEHGDYTYFIGEEVSSFDGYEDSDLKMFDVKSSQYQKFTTPSAKMPQVVMTAWQAIWEMDDNDLGGPRSYLFDFEIYDERASDPDNTILDIYIGVE